MKKLNRHLILRYKIFLIPLVVIVLVPLVLWLTGWFGVMIPSKWTSAQGGDEETEKFSSFVYVRTGEEYYFDFEFSIDYGSPKIKIYSIGSGMNGEIDAAVLNQLTEEDYILLDTIPVTESQTLSVNLNSYPSNTNYLIEVEADADGDYEFFETCYAKYARWRYLLDKLTGK